MITRSTHFLISLSLLLSAAIFGFFYAWVCSTMWGLDSADPRVAIEAMQNMNASVRNAVFVPAFFGTPIILVITAWVIWRQNHAVSASYFAVSAAVYLGLGLLLTMFIHVPMNETLAAIEAPTSISEAQKIWDNYSPKWQFWNQFRTITTGLSFLLAVAGVLSMIPRNIKT